jgi:hypothetical protein
MADMYYGYRDGVRGLPLVPEAEVTGDAVPEVQIGTPRLEVLRRQTADRIGGELLQATVDIARLSALTLPETSAQAAVATERLRITTDSYARISKEPGEKELSIRRLAEDEKKRPEALVAARRLQEYRKREHAARRELLVAAEQLRMLQQRMTAITGVADARQTVARIRAIRQYEHGWRRCATYWQQLVRTHPQGGVLNGLLRPVGPELPAWVTDTGTDRGGL